MKKPTEQDKKNTTRINNAIKVAKKSQNIIDDKYNRLSAFSMKIFKVVNRNLDFILINNFSAKIVSIIFALLLFFSVTNAQENSVFGRTDGGLALARTPLKVEFDESRFVVENLPTEINVTLIGELDGIMRTRNAGNYEFIADLREFGAGEGQRVDIIYTGIANGVDVRFDESYFLVDIFERETETFPVDVEFIRAPLDSEFEYTVLDISHTAITISDAQHNLNNISSVRVLINVADARRDFSVAAPIRVYDINGNIIESGILETIEVKVDVLVQNKAELAKEAEDLAKAEEETLKEELKKEVEAEAKKEN